MVFHWSLSDKFPEVSWTLLSILADLINTVVWMVSTRPLISKPSSLFTNSLVTVPRAPVTMGISVTFMSHSFFNSLAKLRYLSFFTLSFNFSLWSAGTAKSTILLVFFVFWGFFYIRFGRLAEIRWSIFILKCHYYYYYYSDDLPDLLIVNTII